MDKRYIAIIQIRDIGCYECERETIIKSITDWEEVSEEDFKILEKASEKSRYSTQTTPFIILERPKDTREFILNTVSGYRQLALEEEREREAAKKKREEAARRKAEESKAKRIEALRKQLEKLEESS